MNQSWLWIGKYVVVVVAALLLGAFLGDIEPFRSADVGNTRISAGVLVQFVAHMGALLLLWALGLRASRQLRAGNSRSAPLAPSLLALISLVVVASFYGVLMHFIAPLLAPGVKPWLDWTFIGAILALAAWLLWALFSDFEAFLSMLGRAAPPSPAPTQVPSRNFSGD
jgi:eukaryotic-like serine/threonine-protein kinase